MEDFDFNFEDTKDIKEAKLSFLQLIPSLGSNERVNIGFILDEGNNNLKLEVLNNYKAMEKCLKLKDSSIIEQSIGLIKSRIDRDKFDIKDKITEAVSFTKFESYTITDNLENEIKNIFDRYFMIENSKKSRSFGKKEVYEEINEIKKDNKKFKNIEIRRMIKTEVGKKLVDVFAENSQENKKVVSMILTGNGDYVDMYGKYLMIYNLIEATKILYMPIINNLGNDEAKKIKYLKDLSNENKILINDSSDINEYLEQVEEATH